MYNLRIGITHLVWRSLDSSDSNRCPAFFDIRASTVQTCQKKNEQTWSSYFKDWSVSLKTLVCAETIVKNSIQLLEDEVERLSRKCFFL